MQFLSKNGLFFMIGSKAIMEKSVISRTWYLNNSINCSKYFSFDANFISNGEYFRGIQCVGIPELSYHRYNDSNSILPYYEGVWQQSAYRTITLDLPPSGDLLIWLQANGMPQ